MSKLHNLRTWYTLGDAARRLAHRLGEPVTVEELLCIVGESSVPLHFRAAGGVAPARQVIRACAWPSIAIARELQHHFFAVGERVEYLRGVLLVDFVAVATPAHLMGLSPRVGQDGFVYSGAACSMEGKTEICPCVIVEDADGVLYQVMGASRDAEDLLPLSIRADGPELLLIAEELQRLEDRALTQAAGNAARPNGSEVAAAMLERRHLEQTAELESGSPTRPVSRQEFQEAQILSVLRQLGYDPMALPPPSPRSPGAKAAARELMGNQFSRKVFDFAWERLRKDGRIGNREGVSLEGPQN
ncbi:hypothetical protein CAL26_23805 [Bordetella genomosp. 9]|uniref:Uncharacterized protein n=1 Tax=Bordetella genomosp. 9 TaxID=1416803 RepID=A0A261R815_9BORD|nr:hypothetical protein [Bordetella genomosp. 9]OZI20523.1 hypothetical protein CAL26_23805 [Bordetella genomosp. 9]